ncbi:MULTISPECIES: class I SAM-dependent methyltransferase [unclassified Mycolicibacterium]|uniref:class I SAM-dependent methyltransferase n=1 Tax=unclassified Mycolicibacterium TaxID=2636767 RepID=UPI0012DDED13|nr:MULTISPECIES: class I SAM-dependent methyltransferase [unclassified Mycolicibacterium]MUL84577.1 class I SAM-dependent methyltransferase [Mycolicibacterium sp. CBMA 329]MUL88352.1 class I SAM-dependent methyltransferase [Mycolicibacterium sp. CBMA 331]MUL99199.1 class I SAM-dependent methyltransferase [Mycolicibacterium sp. CBMA 334]MUM25040.1 class I SAM-dependent methyltransferase [Mycolicibacterium sp. CBMA 295]MUM39999.1 class I SAM-dependent methyltransferase [Mycolicibacterium sp. CBM
MSLQTAQLTPVEQTALLTLYARALDSRAARPILGDHLADDVVGQLDYDFAGLGVQTSVVCQTALRAKMLDDRVRAFVTAHPDAVVVDLGAGLDSGLYRVSPPDTVDWYHVDLPAVSALREQLLPRRDQSHIVAASLTDSGWPDPIPADRPTILLADGLFAFLSEPVIISIFRRITEHFASGEVTFNDYGRIGWVSRVAIKLYPQKMFKDVGSQWGYPGFKDAHHPETWNPRLRLVEEASLTHAPEVDLFPAWLRVATRISGLSRATARKARILAYRF